LLIFEIKDKKNYTIGIIADIHFKISREGTKYLVISESNKNDKGEYRHDRIMVFEEHFQAVFDGLTKLAPELGVEIIQNNELPETRNTSPND
jgi:hypothetical protein